MGYKFYFEKLEVWQLSSELVGMIYQITIDFPSEEKYGLTSQIRRSAISVPSNLAEGSTRITNKDQAKFTSIAYSSLMELLNQLIIATDLEFLDTTRYSKLRIKIEEISNKLNALRKAQLTK